MMSNNPIRSDDPQAIEKITEKLNACQKSQEYMKAANKYYRKNGTMKGFADLDDEKAEKIDAKIKNSYSWERQPFPQYHLQGNNQEIHRLKKRIEELTRNKEVGFVGWEFEGGTAEPNTEINRLQLFFDEKPSADQRSELKLNGFKWAPSEQAWQRQLNENAVYAASRMVFLKTKDGKLPYQIQPKAPAKDSLER